MLRLVGPGSDLTRASLVLRESTLWLPLASGQLLPVTRSYKYLGTILTDTGLLSPEIRPVAPSPSALSA
eukprot:6730943-Prorocentrum_lima.AAC.1